MSDRDSDSSGTLSSAGGDDDGEDHDEMNIKSQQNRRHSTASSNFLWNEDGNIGIGLMDDNKSIDDSDEDDEQLDAEQLLEQEHEKLQFFDNSLTQCNYLAAKMTGVLQNLQDKLKKLQTTLDPIRRDTTEVARAEKNINKTMSELRKVMEYHALTTEPLFAIKKKTLKASSGLLDKKDNDEFDSDEWNDPFLIWIEKINEAKNYFEENRFKSSDLAIQNLRNIAEIALDRMESYFRDLLKQHTTRNKRVMDDIVDYKLMDGWKERNAIYPLWTNRLMIMNKKNRVNNADNEIVTDLLYIPLRVIKLLANVAWRIEQTANVHGLKDKLSELVIGPRSNLLLDILKSLNDENVLTIQYIAAYHRHAMKRRRDELFKEEKKDTDDDEAIEEEKEEEKEEKQHIGVLSKDALAKLNTMNEMAVAASFSTGDLINDIAIDIKSESHPIILLLHVTLSLFQLERHLCSIILDVKNEVLLEFDEFFNQVIAEPLQFIIEKVDDVLAVKDVMAVTRNAQMQTKSDRRRLSFNQITTGFGINTNLSIEEAAKTTAKTTAKAAIINDSIHKNMIIVKLDLVHCWMRLYPAFDRILNQSKDYGADVDNGHDDDVRMMNHMVGSSDNDDDDDDDMFSGNQRGMLHLSHLGNKLYLNCYDSIEERIRMIKDHKELKNVRVDGGYHPLTIETVKLMFGIYEYRDALQHLYDTQKSVSPMMKILVDNKPDDNMDVLHLQIAQIEKTLIDIVKALRHNIKHKSAQYGNNKKTLEAIFMLNNLHYIVKTIGDTELEIACSQAVLVSLRNDITKWKTKYESASWEKVKEYINLSKLRSDYFTDKTSNLSTKEKRPIKTRYAGFNKEFQQQLNTQKHFSVPDANLRTELINRNIDIVLPMYRIFVGKFKNIEFTKDRGKYHKYDEKTLHDKMHQFFQQN